MCPQEENGGPRSSSGAQHLSPGEGRAWWFLTELYLIKVVSEDTNGGFTVAEVTAPPHSLPLLADFF
jgi:hypothetical protein